MLELILAASLALQPAASQPAGDAPAVRLPTPWTDKVSREQPLPEYPRPEFVRSKWLNLNGPWELAIAGDNERTPPTGKALPHRVLVPFPLESDLSGANQHLKRRDDGSFAPVHAWYRRTFRVPQEFRVGQDKGGNRLMLHFGAADWEATVYVNGKEVGTHRGGYDPFSFDITAALAKNATSRPGDSAFTGQDQEVIVRVFDPSDASTQPRGKQVLKPGGIFYTPASGLWQTVWLEPVPETNLDDVTLVPDGMGAVTLQHSKPLPRDHWIDVTVLAAGKAVGRGSIKGPETKASSVRLSLTEQHLWTPDDPFLYQVDLKLLGPDGKPVDEAKSYFAMRTIALGKDAAGVTRILLNGKERFLMGPLDQGFWPDGIYTAPTDEALRYDIEITKKLGFNATRKHVKIEPARWYYHCDTLGLLVLQDMPSGDKFIGPSDPDITRTPESEAILRTELTRMIESLRDHPSIIGWVVFNEGWGQTATAKYTDFVRGLDPTRLITSASGWTDRGTGDLYDVHVYPGPGMPPLEDKRAAVLGEFGGLGLAVPGHTWTKESWGYRGVADGEDLAFQYENLLGGVYDLKAKGLCAAIYTQITDVETECNGLLTYDRKVVKADAARITAANRGESPKYETLVPASGDGVAETGAGATSPATWKYTTTDPGAGWEEAAYNDSSWKSGPAGFGTKGTPGSTVRTEWSTPTIWVRRSFTLPAEAVLQSAGDELFLTIHHDEDAEVYLNGIPAATVKGYTTAYTPVRISPQARAALNAGENTIAIKCAQTRGGQYIDAGIVRRKAAK